MPLTLNAEIEEAFARATVSPVFLVELNPGTSYKFTDARCSGLQYPLSVEEVTPVKREFDPLTRRQTVSQLSVRLTMTPYVEALLVGTPLKGKEITVTLGVDGATEGNFAPYYSGIMSEVVPVDQGKTLLIKAIDVVGMTLEQTITGYWISRHPKYIARDILSNKISVPSGLIDVPSMYASADTRDSHFCISRGSGFSGSGQDLVIREPVSAASVIFDIISPMLNGAYLIGEDGKISYKAFDASASADATIEDDEIVDVEQVDQVGQVINRVTVNSHPFEVGVDPTWMVNGQTFVGNNGPGMTFTEEDSASQTTFQYPGAGGTGIFEHVINMPWVLGQGALAAQLASGTTAGNIQFFRGLTHSVCGARDFLTVPADAQLSATRVAYLKLRNEIIECDASLPIPGYTGRTGVIDPDTGSRGFTTICTGMQYHFSVGGRGKFGTTPATHPAQTRAFDITIPVYRATELVARWSGGAPVCRIKTRGLRRYALQSGDIIVFNSSRYKAYGHSASDSTLKWEIIGKEYDRQRNELIWTLCLAADSSAAAVTRAWVDRFNAWTFEESRYQLRYSQPTSNADVVEQHVLYGLGVTDAGGLDVDVATGAAAGNGLRAYLRDTATVTLTASKDNYIKMDLETANISVDEVALGAAEPALGEFEVKLAKVVTGAAAISSINGQQTTRAIATDKVASDGPQLLGDNLNFEMGDVGWPTKGTNWSINNDGNSRAGSWNGICATGGAGDSAMSNSQVVKAKPGEKYYAEAWFKSTAGAAGTAFVRITWLDAAKASVGTSDGTALSASTSYDVSRVDALAPSTAYYARLDVVANGNTGGTWYVDDCALRYAADYHTLNTDGDSFATGGSLFNTGFRFGAG